MKQNAAVLTYTSKICRIRQIRNNRIEAYFSRMCRKKYCAAIGQRPLANNSLVATGKNIDTHHVYVNFHVAYVKFHVYVNAASTSFFT